jgi:hypothetical protein
MSQGTTEHEHPLEGGQGDDVHDAQEESQPDDGDAEAEPEAEDADLAKALEGIPPALPIH